MDQLLTQSWQYHHDLDTRMQKCSNHTDLLKKFLVEVQIANDQHSKTLKQISEQFYQDVSKEVIENEVLLCCYNYICHFILNLSHHHTNIANDIHNRIIEPFELFAENFMETNKTLLKSGESLIEELENAKAELIKTQDRYYKKSKEADKFYIANETIIRKKSDPKNKGTEEPNYYAYEYHNKQDTAENLGKEYKEQVTGVNKLREKYDTAFYSVFDEFGINEESRVHFTKLNITQLVRALQEHYNEICKTTNDYSINNFDLKLKELEQSSTKKKTGGAYIINTTDFNQAMRQTKKEEFTSYEAWKKSHQKKKPLSSKAELQMQKENVDAFLALMIDDRHMTTNHNKENEKPIRNGKVSDGCESATSASSVISEGFSSYFDEEGRFNDILSTPVLRKYFLERVTLKLKDTSECPVAPIKWERLVETSSQIVELMTKEEIAEHEQLLNLLIFVTKLYKEVDTSANKHFLGSKIRNKPIFRDPSNWDNISFFLLHRKKLEELQRPSVTTLSTGTSVEGEKEEKKDAKRSMQGFWKRFEGLMDVNKNVKVDEEIIKSQIMVEINTYVDRIRLDQTARSHILLSVAQKLNLDSNSVASIENELEVEENTELYNRVTEPWHTHNRKVQKKGKTAFCLLLVLDFIGCGDKPEEILLVCKEWNQKLKKKIFKIMLSKPDEKLTVNTRLMIWKNIMKINEQDIDYFQLKERFNLVEQKVLPVEDIITMDVQRSFHNHPNINTMILYNLLRLYAHYDTKVSYCQGMNYLMGFFFCHFRNEELSFRFFVAVVNKYMKSLFEQDLESLKASFYQLDRLMGIFLPDLAKHFKKEGIDSSLFSASWFITIFTNVFQFSRNSYTLMRILDTFLLEGWKGLFKVCIYVLEVYQEQMLRMRFDQLLGFLNDFSSKEFFTNFKYNEGLEQSKQFAFFDYQPYEEEKPVRFFAQRIDNVKVTHELLTILEGEFFKLNPPKAVKKK